MFWKYFFQNTFFSLFFLCIVISPFFFFYNSCNDGGDRNARGLV